MARADLPVLIVDDFSIFPSLLQTARLRPLEVEKFGKSVGTSRVVQE